MRLPEYAADGAAGIAIRSRYAIKDDVSGQKRRNDHDRGLPISQ